MQNSQRGVSMRAGIREKLRNVVCGEGINNCDIDPLFFQRKRQMGPEKTRSSGNDDTSNVLPIHDTSTHTVADTPVVFLLMLLYQCYLWVSLRPLLVWLM